MVQPSHKTNMLTSFDRNPMDELSSFTEDLMRWIVTISRSENDVMNALFNLQFWVMSIRLGNLAKVRNLENPSISVLGSGTEMASLISTHPFLNLSEVLLMVNESENSLDQLGTQSGVNRNDSSLRREKVSGDALQSSF